MIFGGVDEPCVQMGAWLTYCSTVTKRLLSTHTDYSLPKIGPEVHCAQEPKFALFACPELFLEVLQRHECTISLF